MPGEDQGCGPEFEYSTEDGVIPAEENEDGKETGQRRMMHTTLDSDFL
jgi:hypothetical protein